MLFVFAICGLVGATQAAYTSSTTSTKGYGNPNTYSGSGTGAYSGLNGPGSYGGPYARDNYAGNYNVPGGGGSYAGTTGPGNFAAAGGGVYGSNFPYAQQQQFPFPVFPQLPIAPVINPAVFNDALNDYFQALQQNYQASSALTYATPENNAYASASLYPDDEIYKQQLDYQSQLFNAIRQQTAAAGAAGGSNSGYAPGFAGASASYGPGGIHQTAQIKPGNPNSPNVDTRFGSSGSGPTGGGPGFYGVSTSSFSESADVNGEKTNRRGAVTTVNDNGKVTTYETHA